MSEGKGCARRVREEGTGRAHKINSGLTQIQRRKCIAVFGCPASQFGRCPETLRENISGVETMLVLRDFPGLGGRYSAH